MKHKVKYTCTHYGRDGHKIEFFFKLAKQQRKERAKARSNFRSAHFVSHEFVAPRCVHRVKQTPFIARNMSNANSDFSHKNTRVVPTGFCCKVCLTNPGTEASTRSCAM